MLNKFHNTFGVDAADWPEYIPVGEVGMILGLTPRELRHLLDKGNIETNREDDREHAYAMWNKKHDAYDRFSFFNSESLRTTMVSVVSLRRYAKNNNIGLAMTASGKIVRNDSDLFGDDITKPNATIDALHKERDDLKNKIQVLENEINTKISTKKEDVSRTENATIGRLKKIIQERDSDFVAGITLACEIAKRGPKANNNPWTEEELLEVAGELGISFKGSRLKLFKEGMPARLVKKTPGARAIS